MRELKSFHSCNMYHRLGLNIQEKRLQSLWLGMRVKSFLDDRNAVTALETLELNLRKTECHSLLRNKLTSQQQHFQPRSKSCVFSITNKIDLLTFTCFNDKKFCVLFLRFLRSL